MFSDEKFELIRAIHLNGIFAMHHVALSETNKEKRPYNTSWWDCRIGATNTALAKRLYYDQLPDFAKKFLDTIHAQEQCHCTMLPTGPRSELAERIALQNERALRDSFIAWLACQPLIGEKMALATAIWGQHLDDPHSTIQGTLAEEFHQNQALVVMIALDPPLEELKKALKYQEEFLEMARVSTVDRVFFGADGEPCLIKEREKHNV